MADNDISNALKDIGYSISRGLAAFGSGQTGFDFEKGFRERDAAMAKAAEDSKAGNNFAFINGQMIPLGGGAQAQPTPGAITGTTPGVVNPGAGAQIDPIAAQAQQQDPIAAQVTNPQLPQRPEFMGNIQQDLIPNSLKIGTNTFKSKWGMEQENAMAIAKDYKIAVNKENMGKIKALNDARANNAGVQMSVKLFADEMVNVVREGKDQLAKVGIELDPSRGIEGLTFAKLNKVMGALGINSPWNALEKGLSIELAAEFAKGAGAQRLGYFILKAFKKTIPKLGDETVEQGGQQLVMSATNAYKKYLKETSKSSGTEVSQGELDAKLIDFKERMTETMFEGFADGNIYNPEMYEFSGIDGDKLLMPKYMIPFYADSNGMTLKEIDKTRKKVQ